MFALQVQVKLRGCPPQLNLTYRLKCGAALHLPPTISIDQNTELPYVDLKE